MPEWLSATDAAACALLLPLAVWIFVSGIDDFVVDIAGLLAAMRARLKGAPSRRELFRAERSRIAVFVPCWHEAGVIADMIERNRERVTYAERDFFVGAYPNDTDTVAAVSALNERFADVHLALCPHDGPTSKADCLNWIYQRMMLHEAEHGVRFGVVVTHDAEDVIHPDAFHWINWYSRDHDMVQVPVLPLRTPWWRWTHGVYCDEFAEYQARDMPARQFMGAFVPSNGVGTGFKREALDDLATAEGNRIFEPVCLTEDYENGLRLKLRGGRQMFVPMRHHGAATREYFPQTFRTAVGQRTRWVTGIALQTWDRHGWRGGWATRYWLWRDRKGLVGNPASLLTNLLFLYGSVTWSVASACGWEWGLEREATRLAPLLGATSVFGVYRMIFRGACVWREFGIVFALLVPVRVVVANCINSYATIRALKRFTIARLRGEPLRWVKTEHEYPNPAALMGDRRRIGQILVGGGYVEPAQLERALSTQPAGMRLGQHLIALGWLDEDSLYEALSLQSGLPQASVDPEGVRLRLARALPARVTRDCRVVPFKVEEGKLHLASPDAPSPAVERSLRRFTSLTPKFFLVTPSNYRALVERLL